MKYIFTLLLFLPFFSHSQTALTGAQIEGAINEAVSKGRVITASSGSVPESALSSLPVVFRTVIDDHKYDIVVTAMNFTATSSVLEVGARFVPNPEMPDQVLYFNSLAVGFSAKHGFKGEMALLPELLSSAKNNQLSPEAVSLLAGRNRFFEVIMQSSGNKMVLGLDENTKLSFNCGAFEKLTLSGYLKVFNSVNQENIAGQSINSGLPLALVFPAQTVYDWNDIFLQATVANHFHSQKLKEFGFHFETPNTALIDFSIRQNPAGLPKCSAESGNYWKGVSLGNFNLRLPEIITRKDGAALSKVPSGGLFMDVNGGLIGQAGADKVIALEHGTTVGSQPLDASLEKAYVTFACNSKIDALLSGKIKVNGCDASARGLTSDYLFTFNESSGFSYKLNYKGGSSNMVTNEIKLESGSSLLVEVRDNGLFITQRANFTPSITTAAYNNSICRDHSTTLTIAGCPYAVEWSNGATTSVITVSPTENTSYSARCYDPYCIEVVTNTIDIAVYESLDTPLLASTRNAEPYCANIEAELSTSAFCPGILEWSENGGAWLAGDNTRKVYYPGLEAVQQFSYKTRCKLNDCYSEESNEVILNIKPKPGSPMIEKSPVDYVACGEVTLLGYNCTGGTLRWTKDGVYRPDLDGTAIISEKENGSYNYSLQCYDPDGCESTPATAHIVIDKCKCKPKAPDVFRHPDLDVVEYGTPLKVQAWGCEGTVIWHNSGEQLMGRGSVLYHVEMGGPHLYRAKCIDANGCESDYSNWVSVTVEKCLNPPSAPEVFSKIQDIAADQNTVYEEGTIVEIQAFGCSGTTTWYNSGGVKVSNDEVYPISSKGDHYFRATCTAGDNDCESGLSSWVRVQIGKCISTPSAPVLSPLSGSVSGSQTITLTASGCGGTVRWSTGFSGGSIQVGAGTYTAQCEVNGCTSGNSNAVTISSDSSSECDFTFSVSADKESVCGTDKATLTALGCSGGTISWNNGLTTTTVEVASGTYIVTCNKAGCDPKQATKNITASNLPSPPVISTNTSTVCGTEQATLTAAACSGTINWSNNTTGSSITVGVGTYTATCSTDCGTSGSSNSVIISAALLPSPPTLSSNKTNVCGTEQATITATGCNGTVSWSNNKSGLSITVGPGTFTATCTMDCGTSGSSTEVIIGTNSEVPSPVVTTNLPSLCGVQFAKLTATGCENGKLEWSDSNVGNNILVLEGTYTVVCITDCGRSQASLPITITRGTQTLTPILKADKELICANETATITIDNCVNGIVKWNDGMEGTTRKVGAGTYTATCTTACGVSESSGNLTINSTLPPSSPIISSNKTKICELEKATLTATGCSGIVKWSDGQIGSSVEVGEGTYSAICQNLDCGSSENSNILVVSKSCPCPVSPPGLNIRLLKLDSKKTFVFFDWRQEITLEITSSPSPVTSYGDYSYRFDSRGGNKNPEVLEKTNNRFKFVIRNGEVGYLYLKYVSTNSSCPDGRESSYRIYMVD